MSLFGFMMYSATFRIPFLMWIGQACITFFFLFIMFHQAYQQGAKSCEYDLAHKLKSSPALGFLFAFLGFLPAILLSAGTVLFPPYSASGATLNGYVPYLLNKTFLQGMYIGIVQAIHPTASTDTAKVLAAACNAQCLNHLISCVPGLIACAAGYVTGFLRFGAEKEEKKKS